MNIYFMKLTKKTPLFQIVNDYLIDSPAPRNLNYMWNFGSLLGVNLIILILTGVSLAMHYNPSIQGAYQSIEHIMRDVNNGWLIRYIHANSASFFFIWVYLHIGRGLYYGSYKSPRGLLWNIGLIIYLVMMARLDLAKILLSYLSFILPHIKGFNIIGPHHLDILSLFVGSLLGDSHMSKIGKNSYHIRFEQGFVHKDYIFWLHKIVKNKGYTTTKPIFKGKIYYFYTYSFNSLKFIYDEFYLNNKKLLPSKSFLDTYLTPLALAIWVLDDGGLQKTGLTLETDKFTKEEVLILCDILQSKFKLKCYVNNSGKMNQYHIRISENSLKD